jgi:FMN phosphatase YigB (HAD superfamily)
MLPEDSYYALQASAGPVSLVIFDMDGVLLDFHPERRLSYLAEATGKATITIYEAIWGSDFEREADAGRYSTGDAYLAAFNARLGYGTYPGAVGCSTQGSDA